jgi:hypothetical protein
MQAKTLGLCYLLLLSAWFPLHADTVRVGPTRELKTLSAAANVVASGTTLEVDAGVYERDVAVWTQDQLTLRAVGGRVLLKANGAHAESKAIWVIRGGQVTVEGFDFSGAEVPDHNGAGIRLEAGRLLVRNCRFIDNENGILTGNNPDTELEIANSEFAHNGYGDGQSHNLYVGAIAKLTVTASYFHHANVGHLLKTRAAVNDIRYNRLTDEPGGRASYELEFANGGVAYVVGNIIEQGAQTQNPHLVSYGAEGYRWPKNELYLINNTLVDDRPDGGIFLRVKPGNVIVQAVNNLLVGKGKLESAGPGNYQNNINVSPSEFEQPPLASNYRLKQKSPLVGKVVDPGTADGVSLRPDAQYVHPMGIQALAGKLRNPGAMQPTRSSVTP